jgi:hypothetical protein
MKKILMLINKASESGNIISLSNLKQYNKKIFTYTYTLRSAIALASYNGHINVLNWFKETFPNQNLYTRDAIEMASCNGQITVLNWFKKHYNDKIIDILDSIILACDKGHLNTLIWFHLNMSENYIKNIDFSCAISHASHNGHIEILDWIYHNISKNFECLYDDMDMAFENKQVNVLYWFKSKFPIEYEKWNMLLMEKDD